jgi:hypothetical protein
MAKRLARKCKSSWSRELRIVNRESVSLEVTRPSVVRRLEHEPSPSDITM